MSIYCGNCGAQLKEGELFCPECGAKAEAPVTPDEAAAVFCQNCGTRNSSADAFCLNCGEKLQGEEKEAQGRSGHKKIGPVLLIGGTAAVVAVAALLFTLPGMRESSSGGDSRVQYYKDNALCQYDGKKVMELTDHLLEDTEEEYMGVSRVARYSKDGRYAFYIKDYDVNDGGVLYYLDLQKQTDKNDTSEKLDSRVEGFRVTSDNKVFYLKDGDSLYVHDLKEKERLASDVSYYMVSEDGGDVVWKDTDGTLYHRTVKKDSAKEKIDSDVESICSSTGDLQTIYYMKDGDLYCIKSFEKERIASEAVYAGSYNQNQGIYYLTQVDEWLSAEEVLNDDLASKDSAMSEPNIGDFKKLVQYWGRSYYDTDYDAYYEAMEVYQDKLSRDRLREEIKNYDFTGEWQAGDLYCYDGKESRELLTGVVSPALIDVAYDYDLEGREELLYTTYEVSGVELPSVRLSSVNSVSEFAAMLAESVEEQLRDGVNAKLMFGGALMDFEYKSGAAYVSDTSHKIIYGYESEESGSEEGTLVSMRFSEKGVESPVTVDDDIQNIHMLRIFDGKAYYLKDWNDDRREGTLYCNGEEIDDDVYHYYDVNGVVYLLKDRSKSSRCGTLAKYTKDQVTDISDDVFSYCVLKGGKIAALTDYSQKRGEGDLYLFTGGDKKQQLDEDVKWIYGKYGFMAIN